MCEVILGIVRAPGTWQKFMLMNGKNHFDDLKI